VISPLPYGSSTLQLTDTITGGSVLASGVQPPASVPNFLFKSALPKKKKEKRAVSGYTILDHYLMQLLGFLVLSPSLSLSYMIFHVQFHVRCILVQWLLKPEISTILFA
jgi:hypothetical protein